jgi:hypothetical protein
MPLGARAVYDFETTFDVPLAFAYRWCTDYTPKDAAYEGERYQRRILERSPTRVVYEDLDDQPHGWVWRRTEVTLHPPRGWSALSRGNYREFRIEYRLDELPDGKTRFRFRGVRRPTELGRVNPPRARLLRELRTMWRRFGSAMAKEYRAKRPTARRPRRSA